MKYECFKCNSAWSRPAAPGGQFDDCPSCGRKTHGLCEKGESGEILSYRREMPPPRVRTMVDFYEVTRLRVGRRPYLKDATDKNIRDEAEKKELENRAHQTRNSRKRLTFSAEQIEERVQKIENDLRGWREELRARQATAATA